MKTPTISGETTMLILVIEDEIFARQSLVAMVKSLGFENILEADDGLKALRLIQKHRPHIVLSDIEMPNLDGIALLERLHKLEIPSQVILVSGHDLFSYAKQAIKYGAFDYILKPVDFDELHTSILKALEGLEEADASVRTFYNKDEHTSQIINHAKSYILENLSSPNIDLNSVAEFVHLSPNYLSKLFKEYTHELFSDFVSRQRIETAMHNLRTTHQKINDISAAVGFSDVKYFYKVFKKYTGLTPSEYRVGPG